jgi:hypothetical protein
MLVDVCNVGQNVPKATTAIMKVAGGEGTELVRQWRTEDHTQKTCMIKVKLSPCLTKHYAMNTYDVPN